jgi:hypothetical protein
MAVVTNKIRFFFILLMKYMLRYFHEKLLYNFIFT